jgi:hypothetical protein
VGFSGLSRLALRSNHEVTVDSHHHGVRSSNQPSGSGTGSGRGRPWERHARQVDGLTPARVAAAAVVNLGSRMFTDIPHMAIGRNKACSIDVWPIGLMAKRRSADKALVCSGM